MITLSALAAALVLTGCTVTTVDEPTRPRDRDVTDVRDRDRDWDTASGSWIGAPASAFFAQNGGPSNSAQMSTGATTHTWRGRNGCEVWITTGPDGRISAIAPTGNGSNAPRCQSIAQR